MTEDAVQLAWDWADQAEPDAEVVLCLDLRAAWVEIWRRGRRPPPGRPPGPPEAAA